MIIACSPCPARCSPVGATTTLNTSQSAAPRTTTVLQQNDPVYGSPTQFYNCSPEYRRNRRLM